MNNSENTNAGSQQSDLPEEPVIHTAEVRDSIDEPHQRSEETAGRPAKWI